MMAHKAGNTQSACTMQPCLSLQEDDVVGLASWGWFLGNIIMSVCRYSGLAATTFGVHWGPDTKLLTLCRRIPHSSSILPCWPKAAEVLVSAGCS